MRELIRKITVTGLIILLITVIIKAQTDYSTLKEQYRKEIQKKMRKHKVKGVSIALVEGDSIIWIEGFGYADVENKIKASAETQYKIASITKLFTGIAVMQLQDRKLLNIDEPVSKFLPEFKIKSRFGPIEEITPRNVLSHTAGIPCDIAKGASSENPEHYSKIIDYLNKEHTIFKPNEVYAYANAGYSLLGCLVEKVSKTPYPDYFKEAIFEPIGMKNSCFREEDEFNMAKPYDGKGKLTIEFPGRDIPAGAMSSTVLDLSKFMSYLLKNNDTNNVLSKESLNEMTKVQFDSCLYWSIQKVGLTWEINETNDYGSFYGHGGDLLSYHSYLMMSMEHKLGAVILTNSFGGTEIAALVKDILKEAIGLKNNHKKAEKKKNLKYQKIQLSNSQLSRWVGNYAGPVAGDVYEVKVKNNKLTTKVQGINLDFIPISKTQFVPIGKLTKLLPIKLKSLRIEFDETDKGTLIYLKNLKDGDVTLVGQRFSKQEITDKWRERVGEYEVVNFNEGDPTDTKIELIIEDNVLILKQDASKKALGIISDDLTYVLGLGRDGGYSVAVEYDEKGDELLRFSGYLLKIRTLITKKN